MNQDTNMQAWMSQLVIQLFQVLSSYAIAVVAGATATFARAVAASAGAIASIFG